LVAASSFDARRPIAARTQLRARGDGWLGTFQAMASPCEVHIAGVDEATAARALAIVSTEAWRIEAKWSRYRAFNIVHQINGADGRTVIVDDETARLLDYAAALHELSGGRFDITSGVLRQAWNFDGSDRLPAPEVVAKLCARIGWQRAQWRSPALTLEPGMEIDFGGIGKEYAVDRAAALVQGICTSCLLNFGGDLLALGPAAHGRPWRVGIEALSGSEAAHEIDLTRGALATSGDARRFLVKNGKRYGHILDPLTGWPVEDAPRSVTVAAPTCTQAGMLATFALLHGAGAEAFLENEGVQHWCLR
jgi:thiamine biosynthesis lipoprotein